MLRDDEFFRAPLLWLLAPYIAGLTVACAGAGRADVVVAGAASLTAIAAVWTARSERRFVRGAWGILMGVAAFLGGLAYMHHAARDQPRWRTLPPREVTCGIEILRVFPSASDTLRQSCIGRITEADPLVEDLVGQRAFFSIKSNNDDRVLLPSVHLKLAGILNPIEAGEPEAGSFEAYLLSTAVRFTIERAEVRNITQGPSALPRLWHAVGSRFETILGHGLPKNHPATSAYAAMMLGKRSELSHEQREIFLRSGTMHLFAISGLHIGVIALSMHALLAACRVPPRVGVVIGLVLLAIFVESTGGTPSERRALVMVGFLWAGSALRRPSNPLASLVASALMVLLLDPLALLSTSFQLSYSVVATILLYGAPLRNAVLQYWHPFQDLAEDTWRWWHRLLRDLGHGVIALTGASISATMISAPLGLNAFGMASPGALVANIAVMPLASVAITGGFASLTTGLVGLAPMSSLFNHAAALILYGVETGAGYVAAVPLASFTGEFSSTWMAPGIVLGLIVLCLTGYSVGWNRMPGRLWGPPVFVLAAMVLLARPIKPDQDTAHMKSAYELAMERLRQSDPGDSKPLTNEQRTRLAEIETFYRGRIAEREISLNQRLREAQASGDHEEAEKIRQQITSEREHLEEEREDEKNRVRKNAG